MCVLTNNERQFYVIMLYEKFMESALSRVKTIKTVMLVLRKCPLFRIQQMRTLPIHGQNVNDICHPYITDTLRYS